MKRIAGMLLGVPFCMGLVCQLSSVLPHEPEGEASFQGLGNPLSGASYSRASAISGDGKVVVGWSVYGYGTQAERTVAFRWDNGVGTELDNLPGASDCVANDVSGDGSVIVGQCWFSTLGSEAFRWTSAEGMVGLGHLPQWSTHSSSSKVSDDGSVVVGQSFAIEDFTPFPGSVFRWSAVDGLRELDDLQGVLSSGASGVSADGSVIVGDALVDRPGATPAGLEATAFRWTAETGRVELGDLPGMVYSHALDVSANGRVVVGQSHTPDSGEAFRWSQASGMVGLGDLPGGDFESSALAVSADGRIIVGEGLLQIKAVEKSVASRNNPLVYNAFIWNEVHGIRELQEVLANEYGLELNGWILARAIGISDDGRTIIGEGTNPAGRTESWIVRLPAPAQ